MSSNKCKKCGLVNFSSATECKRCLNPFDNKQSKSSHFQNFQVPPSPPVFGADEAVQNDFGFQPKPPCIKCGDNQNIAIQNFKKIYYTPIALLGLFLGFLPYFILKFLLRTTHYLSAPFCHECWSKFKNAKLYLFLFELGFLIIFILSIVIAVAMDSLELILVGFVGGLIFYIAGNIYVKGISPKYKKVDSKKVIIDAPLVGEILFTR